MRQDPHPAAKAEKHRALRREQSAIQLRARQRRDPLQVAEARHRVAGHPPHRAGRTAAIEPRLHRAPAEHIAAHLIERPPLGLLGVVDQAAPRQRLKAPQEIRRGRRKVIVKPLPLVGAQRQIPIATQYLAAMPHRLAKQMLRARVAVIGQRVVG